MFDKSYIVNIISIKNYYKNVIIIISKVILIKKFKHF